MDSDDQTGMPDEGRWQVSCLAVSPTGRLLASGSDDGTLRLWRIKDEVPEGLHHAEAACLRGREEERWSGGCTGVATGCARAAGSITHTCN